MGQAGKKPALFWPLGAPGLTANMRLGRDGPDQAVGMSGAVESPTVKIGTAGTVTAFYLAHHEVERG